MVAFLILYYRFLGVVATIGLGVYAVFFFALIKLIPITLTLPGIAGLILTIGVAADANIVIFERIKEEVRAGRSVSAAIGVGYRKGIATIIDANVDHPADRVHPLRPRHRRGQRVRLHPRRRHDRLAVHRGGLHPGLPRGVRPRPAALLRPPDRRRRAAGQVALQLHRRQQMVLLDLGDDPRRRRALAGDQPAQPRDRLRIRHQDQLRPQQSTTVEDVREVLDENGLSNAEVQETEDEQFGAGFQVQASELLPAGVGAVRNDINKAFGIKAGSFESTSVGPTFGEQVARSALLAIIFSLLLITGYVAFRFDPKFAVPVLIAVFHDILITAGVYSLTGREVTSGTVAAFLTILGYSLYDTVIVFDRIRENVPRMPRAAFSQIVNRSMSEVLTRSLITGLSSVFLVGVLLVFGGATLQDFAFAMMVGIFSGTYSSIFIASPVLTAWKEREPGYVRRRRTDRGPNGKVPAFADEVELAKLATDDRPKGRPTASEAASRGRASRGAGRDRRGTAAATAATRRPTATRPAVDPAAAERAKRKPSAGAKRRRSSAANTGGIARWRCWSGSRWGSRSGTSRCSCRIASGRASSAPSSARRSAP